MRKLLVGSALVAAIGIGSLGVAALNPVGAVSAAVTGHTSGDKAGPLSDALDELVGNGTISQDQANAVEGAVQSKRQAAWAKRPHLGKKLVEGIANDLGMAPKDLVAELHTGKSIADVATEKGVDPQKIVDDVVGAIDGKIDQRVAGKKLDQARADAMKQNLPQRVTDFVNRVWGQGKAKAGADQQTPSTEAPSTTEAPATTDTTAAPSTTDTTSAPDTTATTAGSAPTAPGTTAGG